MTSPYFNQFRTPVWQPIATPDLLDASWPAVFNDSEAHIQTNIINGWLWHLNEKMHNINRDQKFGDILNETRGWLRVALPLSTHAMFKDKGFDGTTKSLSNTQSWVENQREEFTASLSHMWFAHGEARIQGVLAMAELLERRAAQAQRNRSVGLGLHYIGNLVQNLAWDVVAEHQNNLMLHINAAKLSALIAPSAQVPPRHQLEENRAWHVLSKVSSSNVQNFNDVNGTAIETIVHKTHPAVAAAVFPILIQQIPMDDRHPNFPYYRKCGVSGLVAKPGATITDYDILRAWIPNKTSYWDSAEELGVHYTDACDQVVKSYLTQHNAPIPADFGPESF